jgi:hypothetical protein
MSDKALSDFTQGVSDTGDFIYGVVGSNSRKVQIGQALSLLNGSAGFFNVVDYGALGDGATDDAPAFQAAIDAAEASSSVKIVYVPHSASGYVFNATVTVPAGVTVRGDNKWNQGLSRIKPKAGFSSPLFQSDGYGVTRILRMALVGLTLDGSSTTLEAVQVSCQESWFQDLCIRDCFTYGLHMLGVGSGSDQQALNNTILSCYFAGQIGIVEFFDALFIDNHCADTKIINFYGEAAKDALIRDRGYNTQIGAGTHLFGASGDGGGAGVGYYSEFSADKTLGNLYIENTNAEGILIDSGASDAATLNATIENVTFRNINKGGAASGVIHVKGSNISSLSISGNVVRRDDATSYSTAYFVHFDSITPTSSEVHGNIGASGLISVDETNTYNWSGNITQRRIGGLWTDSANFKPTPVQRVNIARFERVFVGAACDNDGSINPNGVGHTPDWLEARVGFSTSNTELACVANSGRAALLGAIRAIDNEQAGSNGIACSLYNFNDNAAQVQSSYGLYIESQRSSGAGFTTCLEMDPVEFGTTTQINPYSTSYANVTSGLWCASGGEETSPNDASVGIALINNHAKFDKGIFIAKDAITGTDGSTGSGVAIAMAKGHKLQWYYADNVVGFGITPDVGASGDEQFVIVNSSGIHFQNNSNIDNFRINKVSGTVTGALAVTASTGADPALISTGSATDIPITLTPQGAGSIRFDAAAITTGAKVSTGDATFSLGGERTGSGNAIINFVGVSGSSFEARHLRQSGANGVLQMINTGTGGIQIDAQNASAVTQLMINSAESFRADAAGLNLASGKVMKVNGTQVVSARVTGWTAWTGTASRATRNADAPPTLTQVAQAVKALIDDLISHGLIGT